MRSTVIMLLLLSLTGCQGFGAFLARATEVADTAGVSTSVSVRDGGRMNASVAGNGFSISIDPLSLVCSIARLIPIESPIDAVCRMRVVEETLNR